MTAAKIPFGWTVPAAALVLLARMPDRFLHPQFYAEDAYFYECALAQGARSLFLPYGGYLLSVQRLASFAAAALPPLWVPLFFNAVALGLTLAVVARLGSPRIALSPKPLLALALVLTPRAEDIFLTFENMMWVLAVGLVLLLISSDARGPGGRWADRAMALLFGLTGVFSVILLPLFLWRALQRQTRESALLAATIGVAALIQGWAVLHSPPYQNSSPESFDPALVPAIVGFRLVAHPFGGNWLPELSPFTLSLLGSLWIVLLVKLTVASDLPREERANRWYILAVIGLMAAASLYRFKQNLGMFLLPEHLERYFFLPQVLGLWLILGEISSRRWDRRVLAMAVSGAFLVTCACFFRLPPLVDYPWKTYAPLMRGSQPVNIPINPPGWHFHYPGKPKE